MISVDKSEIIVTVVDLIKERHSMSYYQTMSLFEKVVPGKVKAKLTEGVLDVTLPKSKPIQVQKKKSVNVQ